MLMKWELENGKIINIPDNEIEKLKTKLDIDEFEAIDIWLSDNDIEDNAEQNALDSTAKKVKINHGAGNSGKEKKPRTVKISDEKQALFGEIYLNLREKFGDNVQILKENKLIEVTQGNLIFKVDLIQQRNPKK